MKLLHNGWCFTLSFGKYIPMKQRFVKSLLWILTIYFPFFAHAEYERVLKIPLKEILAQLAVAQTETLAIPIKTPQDMQDAINGKDMSDRAEMKVFPSYPIEEFAANETGSLLAIRVHPAVSPKGANLDKKVILIRVSNNKLEVLKVVTPVGGTIVDFTFSGDKLIYRILRNTPDNDYTAELYIYDPQSKSNYSISSILSLGQVLKSRAFTPSIFVYSYMDQGIRKFSVVEFDAETMNARILRTYKDPERIFELNLLHGADEERNIFIEKSGKVSVAFSVRNKSTQSWDTQLLHVENGVVNIRDGKDFSENKTFVFNNINKRFELSKGSLRIFEFSAKSKIWALPAHVDYLRLYEVQGGYIGVQANHPNYGYLYFKNDGTTEELTATRFRLIFMSIFSSGIYGVGDMNKQDYSVDFFKIILADNYKEIVGPFNQNRTEAPKTSQEIRTPPVTNNVIVLGHWCKRLFEKR